MTIFYTSDQHWHHKNVLEFENRPWGTVEEMNEGLIEAWNKVVKPRDTVHHLGDFSFGNTHQWREILDRLNGKIVLYKGNHDSSRRLKAIQKDDYFKEVHVVGDYFKVHGYQLWLSHYPMEIGLRPRKYSIHGHIHSEPSNYLNQINVGVDGWLANNLGNFGEPIPEDALIAYIEGLDETIENHFHNERNKREEQA